MEILILGSGCKNCTLLEERTKEALNQVGKSANVKKVTDMMEIVQFGVMSTPALVIDGKVVLSGRLPSVEELKDIVK